MVNPAFLIGAILAVAGSATGGFLLYDKLVERIAATIAAAVVGMICYAAAAVVLGVACFVVVPWLLSARR